MQKVQLRGCLGDEVIATDTYLRTVGNTYATAQLITPGALGSAHGPGPVPELPAQLRPFTFEKERSYLELNAKLQAEQESEATARSERLAVMRALRSPSETTSPGGASPRGGWSPRGILKSQATKTPVSEASVAEMQGFTQAPAKECEEYIRRAKGDVKLAIERYYAHQEDASKDGSKPKSGFGAAVTKMFR